jgi:hypothetical protein
MSTQDLETAPHQKRQEKKVEKVRHPKPQWIVKIIGNSAPWQFCLQRIGQRPLLCKLA